jgi:hypothetical protein
MMPFVQHTNLAKFVQHTNLAKIECHAAMNDAMRDLEPREEYIGALGSNSFESLRVLWIWADELHRRAAGHEPNRLLLVSPCHCREEETHPLLRSESFVLLR